MRTSSARRAGLLVPLFSIPSTRSWGIGEIGDLEPMCGWLARAGQRVLLMLPINEMPVGESSPYSALSAMAIDPQFITLAAVEDFAAIGGEDALDPEWRARLAAARAASAVDYESVRALKSMALHLAFAQFQDYEWKRDTARAARFRAYTDEQAWWLDDYALFRALHAHHGERAWTDWPQPVRDRTPEALTNARIELDEQVRYRKYVQWIAGEQWTAARSRMSGVSLFGDLPFAVSGDSADVWARQDEFNPALSVGVPPDAFSATGQDWGLPAYRWDVLADRDFDWLVQRARRNADLFDGYRVDHLVGFYRMFVRPLGGGNGVFMPAAQAEQTALGERILRIFGDAGAEIIAETGDMVVVDARKPYDLTFQRPLHGLVLSLPRARFGDHSALLEQIAGQPINLNRGRASVLSGFIRSAWDQLVERDEEEWPHSASEVIWDLLGSIIQDNRASDSPSTRAGDLRCKATRLIDHRLIDPEFRSAAIAEELGVSERYVQRAEAQANGNNDGEHAHRATLGAQAPA
jgi:hypothetical protein